VIRTCGLLHSSAGKEGEDIALDTNSARRCRWPRTLETSECNTSRYTERGWDLQAHSRITQPQFARSLAWRCRAFEPVRWSRPHPFLSNQHKIRDPLLL